MMSQAQKSLTISTPYFVPDAVVLNALLAASYRGVKVKLIVPKTNDSWIVAAASRSYYRRLLGAGIEIHEYKNGLLHAKTLTIDGLISLIGSTNLDLRSFDLNYENDILLHDKTLTGEIYVRQTEYIDNSMQVSLQDVDLWPRTLRIWYNIVATIGPIL